MRLKSQIKSNKYVLYVLCVQVLDVQIYNLIMEMHFRDDMTDKDIYFLFRYLKKYSVNNKDYKYLHNYYAHVKECFLKYTRWP